MLEDMKANIVHNVCGTYCPIPISELSNQIKNMNIGDIIELIADDPGVVEDVPSWCKATGNEFLGVYEEDGEFHSFVRKLKD